MIAEKDLFETYVFFALVGIPIFNVDEKEYKSTLQCFLQSTCCLLFMVTNITIMFHKQTMQSVFGICPARGFFRLIKTSCYCFVIFQEAFLNIMKGIY